MAQDEEETRKISYPLDPSSYKILQEIGTGVSATVYKASCLPMNSSLVAIKAIDLERSRANLDDVRREAKALSLLSHPNILRAHCSFTVDHHLWVVMPFMSAGSLHSIISSSFPDGLNESSIAVVLKETLNALLYLHDQGHLHRDIKAGNILVDSDGSVKLTDFGVSASIYEPNSSQASSSSSSSSNLMFNDVAGTPYWMAPEVIHSHVGYSFKADIWSFGITALELAHGRPPLSHLPPWKSLFLRITNRLRLSDYEKNKKDRNKKFTKNFRDMVASCLATDPSKRPTAEKLLKHPFFRNCRSVDFLVKNVLQGLPTIEERYRESLCYRPPQATADDDAGDDEELGPVVKQRRISGWNFNEKILELYPVFPTEKEGSLSQREDNSVKRVRFGEETIIQNTGHNYVEEIEKIKADSSRSTSPSCSQDETNVETDAKEIEGKEEEDRRAAGKVAQCIVNEPEIRGTDDVGIEINEEEADTPNPPVQDGMVAAAPLVPNLIALMDSLEAERQMVSNLIAHVRGGDVEMSREEQMQQMIAQLSLQVEKERRRSSLLEMELESLRRRATTGQRSHGVGDSSTSTKTE